MQASVKSLRALLFFAIKSASAKRLQAKYRWMQNSYSLHGEYSLLGHHFIFLSCLINFVYDFPKLYNTYWHGANQQPTLHFMAQLMCPGGSRFYQDQDQDN